MRKKLVTKRNRLIILAMRRPPFVIYITYLIAYLIDIAYFIDITYLIDITYFNDITYLVYIIYPISYL
jgi:hypothetical protein